MSLRIAGRRAGMAVTALLAASLSLPVVAAAPAGAEGPTTLVAGGSIDEAWLTGARPGDSIALHDGHGGTVTGKADAQGALIIRNLSAGGGYSFEDSTAGVSSSTFSVLDRHVAPDPSIYEQVLKPGINYVTMRDGIKIAMTLRLPPGKTLADGPFPTVMEYSGYNTAAPHALDLSGEDPLSPSSSTMVGALLAPTFGYASVSVQMRGSGCSGGAFDLFGYPTDYDGYDAIETIATQPWVIGHKVGMVGISYSAISQLEVAGTQPPHLAAIAPLSPTDDLFSTGYPGGIYNNGFAKGWIAERIHDAKAALVTIDGHTATAVDPGVAQPWTYAEINAELKRSFKKTGVPSSTCLDNQVLHSQSESLSTLVGPDLLRDPALFDRRSPTEWARSITAPVFVVGALQDEQTGPQWPAVITALSGNRNVFATMINGGHIDSIGPETLTRMIEFLDIFVGRRAPEARGILGVLAPSVFAGATGGAGSQPVPAIRFTDAGSKRAAKAAFKASDPRVRVLFENGAGSAGYGGLSPAYEAGFGSWPAAGTMTTFTMPSRGTLSKSHGCHPQTGSCGNGGDGGQVGFSPDASARPATSLGAGGGVWAARPDWNWTKVPSANGLAFQTAPLAKDLTIVGPARLNLSINPGSATSVDLQATVTEVRDKKGSPSKEMYVTSGFLRSDFRDLLGASTPIWAQPDYSRKSGGLAKDSFTTVAVPIDPIAHTFRAGTRLRIVITAPGGDRPAWTFDTPGTDPASTLFVGLRDSTFVVNVVSGVTAPARLPTCGSLRGEPCRRWASVDGFVVNR